MAATTRNSSKTPAAADNTTAAGQSWAATIRAKLAAEKKATATANKEAKAAKAKTHKEPRPCACGCGQTTKSTFAPGHDAQLASAFLAVARGDADLTEADASLRTLFVAWATARSKATAGTHVRLTALVG